MQTRTTATVTEAERVRSHRRDDSAAASHLRRAGRAMVVADVAAAADPMVGCWNSKNSFFTKRSTLLDLPTAVSPSSTSLKFTVLAIADAAVEDSTGRRE